MYSRVKVDIVPTPDPADHVRGRIKETSGATTAAAHRDWSTKLEAYRQENEKRISGLLDSRIADFSVALAELETKHEQQKAKAADGFASILEMIQIIQQQQAAILDQLAEIKKFVNSTVVDATNEIDDRVQTLETGVPEKIATLATKADLDSAVNQLGEEMLTEIAKLTPAPPVLTVVKTPRIDVETSARSSKKLGRLS